MNISPSRIAQQAAGLFTHSGKVDWDGYPPSHSPKRRMGNGWKAMARRVKHRANKIIDQMCKDTEA